MDEPSEVAQYDVVLVQPSIIWVYDPFEHLGLAYLAASLRRAGFLVKIVDGVLERYSMADLYKEVCRLRPRVLGVTLISHGYKSTVRLLRHVRAAMPEVRIVGGGHFASFAAKKIMADTDVFDAIALGEADENLVDYCRQYIRGEAVVAGGFVIRGGKEVKSHRRIDLATLPFPSRDLLPLALQRGAQASVTSSRGCYARCSFCTVHNFYQRTNGTRWFSRPIDHIIEELHELYRRYKLQHFNFVDDNFVGAGPVGRQRVFDFAERYTASGLPMTFHIDCRANDVNEEMIAALVRAGLKSVFLGIESISREDLIDYRKGLKVESNWRAVEILRRHGLEFTLAMIMFNPKTTRASIIDNVNYLKSVEYYPRNPISILNIYEGTDVAVIYKEHVYGPFWDYRFRFAHVETAAIYEAALKFCRDTLPLERVLSLTGPGRANRVELNRIRLYGLGDLAEQWGSRSPEAILEPSQESVRALRATARVDAVATAREARFGRERLYIQNRPLVPWSDLSVSQ